MDRLLEATARAERDHFWFRGFRRFVEPFVAEAVDRQQRAVILDCGCGTGHNLGMLSRHGRAYGIDVTWSGLMHARSQENRTIAQASATQLPFPSSTFDLVTSFDVLYALDDHSEREALKEMYRVIRPGGQLLVTGAALKSLTGNHSLLSEEVRRYDRADLRQRLERAGFVLQRITYTYFTLLPIVAGVRFAQRLAGHRESEDEIRIPPAPVNAALSAVLAVEAAALRFVNMPLGSSLLASAKKPATTGTSPP